MKNTLKRIIAVILSLVMIAAVGSLCAFAADENKTLQWNIYSPDDEEEYFEEYEYAGVASEGNFTLPPFADDDFKSVYYDFNVVNAGYYLITTSDGWDISPCFPELFENGVAYGVLSGKEPGYENGFYRCMYYLEAGQTVLGFDYWNYSDEADLNVTVEYFGDSISDIQIDEKYFDCIIDEDIRDFGNGEGRIYNTEAVVAFSSGKTIDNDNFVIKLEKALAKGANNAELCFLNYSEPVVINAFEATDFVTKLEVSNIEKYLTSCEYYNGYIGYPHDVINETMTVTLANNNETIDVKLENCYGEITLPNGRTYGIYMSIHDVEMTFSLIFANHVYAVYEIKPEPADFSGNLDELKSENSSWISRVNCDAQNRLNQLKYTDDIGEKISLLFWIPGIYSNAFFQIICNIIEFIEFYAAV